jgi:hypothetical protein
LLFPPILTTYNGEALPERIPTKVFKAKLPTEVANERGVLAPTKRTTEVRVYQPLPGETPTIYERGIQLVFCLSLIRCSVTVCGLAG